MSAIVSKDVYEIVTNTIIEKLEEGVVPWQQPWREIGVPRNYVTKRPYRGLNLLLLNALAYPYNEFLTFRQVQDLGGRVSKGEKGHLVILWLWLDDDKAREENDEAKPRKRPMLRYYHVYNIAQCTGIYLPKPERSISQDPIFQCESLIHDMPNRPKIVHNENEAYYHPVADYINMPKPEMFDRREKYYSTLFHELVHSTGHESRLNRKELVEITAFGSEVYSMEELTAEIGACFLTSYAGIALDNLRNHVAYIKGWLSKLREDKKLIVHASAQAQKAVDYILNVSSQEDHETLDAINRAS